MTQTGIAALIALAQDSARIVLGDDATAAAIAELTETMRPTDWADLALMAGLPAPDLAARCAIRDHLHMDAAIAAARDAMRADR